MLDPLSDTLSALADPTRRAILARLSLGEATVGELAKPFAMSGPAVTKHLNVLEKAGLIRRGRDAQRRPCRLEAARLKEAAEYLVGFRQFFEGSLDRLEDYLHQLKKKDQAMSVADTTAEPEEDRSIVIERLIAAPRELVFQAFTAAEHLAHWWGPNGFSITTFAFDFRVGGVWRFVMHGPDGRDYQNRLVFQVIEPPTRIVSIHGGDGDDALEFASHETRITLEAEGDETRLTWRLVFVSIAERDRLAREYGAVEGGQQTVGRLAAYVAELG